MILSEKRDAENEPRDIDVLYALGVAGRPDRAHHAAARPRHRDGHRVHRLRDHRGLRRARPAGSSASSPAGALVAFVAVQVGILKQYQVDRLTAFTDPTADPRDIGYNTQQARIAIGSGGLFGTGLFHGPQTQGRFVPENQTDFVYSVAGEELGFVGAGGIIALLG